MKKLVLLFITLISVCSIQAQATGSIQGKIIDKATGELMPFVSVHLHQNGVATQKGAISDIDGKYIIDKLEAGNYEIVSKFIGFEDVNIKNIKVNAGAITNVDVEMKGASIMLEELVIEAHEPAMIEQSISTMTINRAEIKEMAVRSPKKGGKKDRRTKRKNNSGANLYTEQLPVQHNTEDYAHISENEFRKVGDEPLSTFSIDVDNASYSNMRRYVTQNSRPPKDAVRIEEMVNYFTYEYPQPEDEHPFSITTETSECPWDPANKLFHVGLQGKNLDLDKAPSSNLVFLLDVSGSMGAENKLGLVKKGMKLLVNNLREKDKVAIVVYAGAAGLVLPSTSDKKAIIDALDKLNAGGSTAGGAGIKLAYKIAKDNFAQKGNNRVILATDGDFNIGASSDGEMVRLIEEKRKDDIFLTVLGFGMGNYKDNKLELLADKGNGNYAYIDNIREAKKVFATELGGTLYTIAKDVKLQLEFNPHLVSSYRLIGYENRLLNNEDFNDDTKDAGELGAGHTVTALYELVLTEKGKKEERKVDDLKYQSTKVNSKAKNSNELLTVKFRYKSPRGIKSKLIEHAVANNQINLSESSDNFRWSAAVAGFGMLLRDSKFKGNLTYAYVQEMAEAAKGGDAHGYRAEFIQLVESCGLMFVEAKK